jgi:hypothetical protein
MKEEKPLGKKIAFRLGTTGSGLNIQQVKFLNTDLWCHP